MSKLVRLKHYYSAIEANRDKQILAENGIDSWIANEQTIQSDWLLSQAIGGIQLHVFEENLEISKEVLQNSIDNEQYSLEVEHTIPDPEFDFVCPKCGSNHLYRDEKPGGIFGISMLLINIPLKIPSPIFHCYYCGNEFRK